MSRTVTLIPGDSLGAELTPIMQRVVAAAGVDVRWEMESAGEADFAATGEPLPEGTLASSRKNKLALKGRIWTPIQTGYASPDRKLRKALDLYAVVRPIQSFRGLSGRHQNVDLVVIREGTEDVNIGLEHEIVPGVTQSIKVTTRAACERIVRFAFEYAGQQGRQQVTLVHKANIMKLSDGLFMRCGQEIAEQYPEIRFRTIIADNACMQLVSAPHQFDVLVAQNLFGEILSNLGAGLVGGISAVWGELRGDDDLRVFEVLHGIAPKLTGRCVANPLPFLQPLRALLSHLGEGEAADRLGRAISETLEAGIKTADLCGNASTDVFTNAVVDRLK